MSKQVEAEFESDGVKTNINTILIDLKQENLGLSKH